MRAYYLGRQAIVDREKKIVAYELLFRKDKLANEAKVANNFFATQQVINGLNKIGVDHVLDQCMGLINVDENFLFSEEISNFCSKKWILEILETVEVNDLLLKRLDQLRHQGIQFALDDVVTWGSSQIALLPFIDVIKVDLEGLTEPLPDLLKRLKVFNGRLLAEKISTTNQFEMCLACGFDWFQGYWIHRPEILTHNSNY